jgi:hypothetical protein
MTVNFTLTAEDVSSARLRAAGIFPTFEIVGTLVPLAVVLGLSATRFAFPSIGLFTGGIGGFAALRLLQASRIQTAAVIAYRANAQLRATTVVSWNESGVTITSSGFDGVRLGWNDLSRVLENKTILVLVLKLGIFYAIPKRAFTAEAPIDDFRENARRQLKAA